MQTKYRIHGLKRILIHIEYDKYQHYTVTHVRYSYRIKDFILFIQESDPTYQTIYLFYNDLCRLIKKYSSGYAYSEYSYGFLKPDVSSHENKI